MIYELTDTSKVKPLFEGWNETLILRCLDEGLYPSEDAQNMASVHLAEKLGYEFDHEYTAYEVTGEEKTHNPLDWSLV